MATHRFVRLLTLAAVAVPLAGLIAGAQGARTTKDGVYTEAQAKLGEATYKDRCAACHSDDLSGGIGPALSTDAFSGHWVDKSVGDLFTQVKSSMPADNPGSLSDSAYAELVAFVLKSNGYPAGPQPLPSDAAKLQGVMFSKP